MSKFNATHKTPDGELLHSEGGKLYTRHAYDNFGAAYVGEAIALGSAEEHSWEDDLRELGLQRSKLAGKPAQSQLGFDPVRLQAAAIALDLQQAGTNAHQSTWLVSHDMETVHDVEQQLQVYGVYLKGQGRPVAYDVADINVDLVSRYYNSPIAPPQARVYILAVYGIVVSPYDRICQAGRDVLSAVTNSPDQLRHVTINGKVAP